MTPITPRNNNIKTTNTLHLNLLRMRTYREVNLKGKKLLKRSRETSKLHFRFLQTNFYLKIRPQQQKSENLIN